MDAKELIESLTDGLAQEDVDRIVIDYVRRTTAYGKFLQAAEYHVQTRGGNIDGMRTAWNAYQEASR